MTIKSHYSLTTRYQGCFFSRCKRKIFSIRRFFGAKYNPNSLSLCSHPHTYVQVLLLLARWWSLLRVYKCSTVKIIVVIERMKLQFSSMEINALCHIVFQQPAIVSYSASPSTMKCSMQGQRACYHMCHK